MLGYFNALDWDNPNTGQPFATEQAMLDAWYSGRVSSIITSTPPSQAHSEARVGQRYVVVISKKIQDGLDDCICAASPEQRDMLPHLQNFKSVRDLKLMTQQQFLADSSCVDVFVTAVQQPSPFLAAIPFPFYLQNVPSGDVSFAADRYPLAYNMSPVDTISFDIWRCN